MYVVRLYDAYDNIWMDVSGPVTIEEARAILVDKTCCGTRNSRFSDGDYYSIFPSHTTMGFSVEGYAARGELPPR